MQSDNVFERRKRDQASEALSPEQAERASINELTVQLHEYVSAYALKVEAALENQTLSIRKTDDGRRLSVEAVGDTFVTFDKSREGSESNGPFTRDELVDEIHRWLSAVPTDVGTAKSHSQNESELDQALGRALVTVWPNVPRDIQQALFENAAAELDESRRDDLAIYLHEHRRKLDLPQEPLPNP